MPKRNKKQNKRNRKPTNFRKSLTPKQMRREVRAAGRAATAGEERILKGERRTSKAQSRRIRDFFPQYNKEIGKAAARTSKAYETAGQQIDESSKKAQDYAETLRQRLAKEAQSDANLRGVQTDTSGSQTSAQAQLARIGSSDTLKGVTSAQGASQQAYLRDKQRIGSREKIEQLLQEQERRRSFTGDLRELAKRKGEAKTAERGRLRAEERDFYLGLLAARGNKAARRQSGRQRNRDRREGRRDRKRLRKQANLDRREARQRAESKGGRQKGGGIKRGEVRSAVSKLRNAGNPPKNARERRKATDWLHSQGIPLPVARRAVAVFAKGGRKKKGGGNRGRPYSVPGRPGPQ